MKVIYLATSVLNYRCYRYGNHWATHSHHRPCRSYRVCFVNFIPYRKKCDAWWRRLRLMATGWCSIPASLLDTTQYSNQIQSHRIFVLNIRFVFQILRIFSSIRVKFHIFIPSLNYRSFYCVEVIKCYVHIMY